MRIVSLLPSATEIVYALGLEDQLEAVTFECDFPVEARTKPWITGTALTSADGGTAQQINDEVATLVAAGAPVYSLDRELVRSISPDLILAQDLCAVCAVPSGAVEEALESLGCEAQVVSLDPASLDDVIAGVGIVGAATDRVQRAEQVMAQLRARVKFVKAAVHGRPRPRVLALEWSDPPFNAGHWVPDMIEAAGGKPSLASAGEKSIQLDWNRIKGCAAEIVVFMPCGYSLEQSIAEGRALMDRPELAHASQVWALAGDAYFSRPGPRVVDGVEALAGLLHPDSGVPVNAAASVRLR